MQSVSQPKLSEREIARAWAQITIKRWRKKIDRLKIGQHSSGELFRSFQFRVLASAGGDVQKIEFAFRYYGKFVDMGVGRGKNLGDQPMSRSMRILSGKLLGMKRVPKKWYSKTFYAETQKLIEILQEEYGHRGQIIISENINDNSIH
jgi:hypothetical protein